MKAFPIYFKHPTTGAIIEHQGMDLRDYFAGMAMLSMNLRKDYVDAPANVIAIDSYMLADEMIEARGQE